MKHRITVFPKDEDFPSAHIDVTDLGQDQLAQIFDPPPGDLLDGYPVTQERAAALSPLVGVTFDLENFEYFLDCELEPGEEEANERARADAREARKAVQGIAKHTIPSAADVTLRRFLVYSFLEDGQDELSGHPHRPSVVTDVSQLGLLEIATILGIPQEWIGYSRLLEEEQASALARAAQQSLPPDRAHHELRAFTSDPMTTFRIVAYPLGEEMPEREWDVSYLGPETIAGILGIPQENLEPVYPLRSSEPLIGLREITGLPLDPELHDYDLRCSRESNDPRIR